MTYKTNIRKWDNDLAVLIPDEVADELGLTEGATVGLSLDGEVLSIRRRKSLEEMIESIDPDNLPETI